MPSILKVGLGVQLADLAGAHRVHQLSDATVADAVRFADGSGPAWSGDASAS